jgi:hypothetical protein
MKIENHTCVEIIFNDYELHNQIEHQITEQSLFHEISNHLWIQFDAKQRIYGVSDMVFNTLKNRYRKHS